MGQLIVLANNGPRAAESVRTGPRPVPGGRLRSSAALILIAAMFGVGTAAALIWRIPVSRVMEGYSYDVLVILMVMELFTNLIMETGVMQVLAVKLARLSRGRERMCLVLFGTMMFLISSCLNNITAVMMLLPIVFLLLRPLEVDRRYVCIFFSVILALSNTGGAASGVGDFPAIILMTSGITDFLGYLVRAFPLFAVTSAALLAVWSAGVGRGQEDEALRRLAIANLRSQYQNVRVRTDVLARLMVVFTGMFLAWSLVPQDVLPPEMIAVLGYGAAMVLCALRGVRVKQELDLRSVLTVASFLFFAQVISQTGVLEQIAGQLQARIHDPKLLVMAIMLITSLVAGVFSAGPAAAAMLPIVVGLCQGPLGAQSHWIAVAYAAAICAGSSLFLWSATAGFLLSHRVNQAGIPVSDGGRAVWGVGQYLKCGLINYAVQMSIALAAVAVIL